MQRISILNLIGSLAASWLAGLAGIIRDFATVKI
jgi:hypothetical protein